MLLRDKSRHASEAAIGSILFLIIFVIFWLSPVHQVTESRYSMLLSQCLLEHRSFDLAHYKIPKLEPVYHDHTWKNGNITQIELVGPHLYYYMPPGSSVLSIPFVALMNAFGIAAHNADGTFNPAGEIAIEITLAALLMAAFSTLTFFSARLLLPVSWSVSVCLSIALGTQVWSTASRGLWADTWGILLAGVVVYLLLADAVGKHRLNGPVLASLLSWAYFVRPSNAIMVVAVSLYLLLRRRDILALYVFTGACWLMLFVTYSWIHYQAWLPTYFRVNRRLTLEHIWAALAGNLVSPSRGLFVFVPMAAFVVFVAWWFRDFVVSRPLLYLASAVGLLYLISVSTFDPWWAGASFGPRYLTPLVPWLSLLAILGLAAILHLQQDRARRALLSLGCLLLLLSVATNGIGAISQQAWNWNTEGDIDHDPNKVWSLRDSQLLAPFRTARAESFPPLPTEIELASTAAQKYLGHGWSGAEEGFRWTDGVEATILFSTEERKDMTMQLRLTPFLVPGKHVRQRLELLINGTAVSSLVLESNQPTEYELKLPAAVLREKNVLTFRLPDAQSPINFQLNPDARRLGVAVQWIKFRRIAAL